MGDTATVDAAPPQVDAAPPQHLQALERANRVRLARADLKRRIATQQITVVDVVANCPWQARGMSVSDLLMSQRRWGRTRCRRLLTSLQIPENKPIGTLTERQRTLLTQVLEARCMRGEAPPPPPPTPLEIRSTATPVAQLVA